MSNETVQFVSIEKAAELLNKTPNSVRQLISRGKIGKNHEGRRVCVPLQEVLTYYARKRKIPSWEENIEKIKEKSFMSGMAASTALLVQIGYVTKLVQKGLLEGYVTVNGDLMVVRESINAYMGTLNNDTKNM